MEVTKNKKQKGDVSVIRKSQCNPSSINIWGLQWSQMVTPSGSKWHQWSQKYLKMVKTWTRTSMKLTGTAWRCRDSPLDFQNRGLRGSPKLDTTGEISIVLTYLTTQNGSQKNWTRCWPLLLVGAKSGPRSTLQELSTPLVSFASNLASGRVGV